MRNQIVKHYLRQWGYLDKNINYLSNTEAVKIKTLYSALKELQPEERKFLAVKYRVPDKHIVPDAAAAAQQGMDLKEYKEKRIAIEDKLCPFIDKHVALHQEELDRAIGLEYQR